MAAPGLEEVVQRELRALGHAEARTMPGGVLFEGGLEAVLRANLWLRTASRVLLRIGAFDAPGRRELTARASRFDWSPFFPAGAPIQVHATAQKSRLYHTGLIADALHEALKTTPAPKDMVAPEVHARFVRDRCTLSIDTSGELLHKRGWRQESSRAPLRETLAAAMVALSGYDGTTPFLDPMCGSGTIAIEAALLAGRRAPGLGRSFAFEQFASFDEAAWAKRVEAAKAEAKAIMTPIAGSDVHSGALAAAKRNAERAGVADVVTFERRDVRELKTDAPTGVLATNPPYGVRVGGNRDSRDADESVNALGQALRGPFRKWTRAVLSPGRDRPLGGLTPTKTYRLDNGGIPVDLLVFAPDPSTGSGPA